MEALKKLADSSHELSLRLPTQSSLLSNFGALGEREQAPMFKRFEREVAVFATLQRPKKVIALGDDGRAYPYLLKTTDDLRKDARMTELQSLMNALLRRDRATAMRGLSVRTYIVLPLSLASLSGWKAQHSYGASLPRCTRRLVSNLRPSRSLQPTRMHRRRERRKRRTSDSPPVSHLSFIGGSSATF